VTASPFTHQTVMRDEVVRALNPRASGVYADVTLGGGGHAEAILSAAEDVRLVALDRDETAIAAASLRLARYLEEGRLRVVHASFGRAGEIVPKLVEELARSEGRRLDGLVADLGISSPQIDDAERGMSLRREASSAPLDMRMDRSVGETACQMIERLTETELANLVFELGEERRSRKIARSIKLAAEEGRLTTTGDLRHAIYSAVGGERQGGLDPATRTFQALRIAVNDELGELDRLLASLPTILADDAVAVVISFHSLEDGRVKRAFRGEGWDPITKRPVVASDEEVERNPRARSAKLRAARRRSHLEARPQNGVARYLERRARRLGREGDK
jgi:16S rRNA (cytosine1402-N4)-methyltransferase